MATGRAGKSRIVRRQQTRVVVSLPIGVELRSKIVELGREWNWDLLDLSFTHGVLPTDPPPSGAIIEEPASSPLYRRLQKAGCPTVRMTQSLTGGGGTLPTVVQDFGAAGRLAAEHFAERGFRHVAYVGHIPWADRRLLYEGFQQRARELEMRCHLHRVQSHISGLSDTEKYRRRMLELGAWLSELPKPVGVLGYNDWMAARLCVIAQQGGLGVPEQVALLGVDNTQACDLAPVSLSSVKLADEEFGRQAALLLHRLMQGARPPVKPIWVPPVGVVTRRSTDLLAVSDPVVARAMRFMWDHLNQNLGVGDVAAEVGVHRRQLERAFHRELGRGVNAELRRRRMQECCRLLRNTELPVVDVATKTGFRTMSHMHRSIRAVHGVSARQYRVREQKKQS